MIVAGDDDLIPQQSTQVLWDALDRSRAEVDRIDHPAMHLRGTGDPHIAAMVTSAPDWMQRVGLR